MMPREPVLLASAPEQGAFLLCDLALSSRASDASLFNELFEVDEDCSAAGNDLPEIMDALRWKSPPRPTLFKRNFGAEKCAVGKVVRRTVWLHVGNRRRSHEENDPVFPFDMQHCSSASSFEQFNPPR